MEKKWFKSETEVTQKYHYILEKFYFLLEIFSDIIVLQIDYCEKNISDFELFKQKYTKLTDIGRTLFVKFSKRVNGWI